MLLAVIDEGALCRMVVSPALMREQLAHLLKTAERPKVMLQVVPLDAGPHPGMAGPHPGMAGPITMDLTRAGWRKSSYSGNGGNTCVEVGAAPRAVAVRDSQDPEGPRLAFTRETWQAFIRTIKAGTART